MPPSARLTAAALTTVAVHAGAAGAGVDACATAPLPLVLLACATWSCDACLCQPLMLSRPQSASWSMYSSSSSQVITPGVESGWTKSGHLQFGYAPTSLHILSHSPASMFCRNARYFLSLLVQV